MCLAAYQLRLRLLTELADSGYRDRELVTLVSEPHNLVSYQAALAPRRRAVRVHQHQRPLTDRRGPATPPRRHPPLKEIQP